jgi:nickel-type superoxide dismutase maturation protease
LQRFIVADTSMRPALEPGDRVLVLVLCRTRVRPGDLVVFCRPDQRLTVAIKRVTDVAADGALTLLGDNPNASTDSRDFGPVPRHLVIGKAIYRYLPGPRRSRL